MLQAGNGSRSAAPMPSFDEFYRAVNGRDPFPWQTRLARQVDDRENWPGEVGVPTGLGKTACLDIAIWWLASQADRAPADRTAPTRIWWIVNRRLLVDSTAMHAEAIGSKLENPAAQGLAGEDVAVLKRVADRLRTLSADRLLAPLEVIRLRGGVAPGRPSDPSAPAVILSTLPMYGSRLLFQGYGSGSLLRPVDAALAGTDSLILLDEAHLAPHLVSLIPTLTQCARASVPVLGGPRAEPAIVALTATGDAPKEDRFDLNHEDEAHGIVRCRLDAEKPMRVLEVSGDGGRALAQTAEDLLREASNPAACIVFANTPRTARAAFDRLRKTFREREAEVLLLTGRSREREAERVRALVLDRKGGMPADRDNATVRARHLIVVATQTLEVGADLDAEILVTENCGVRALTQRLGRLNRLGRCPRARAAYVHLPPKKLRGSKEETWPVYGNEPATVLERLKEAMSSSSDEVDLSPRRAALVLGSPDDDTGRAPELLHGILWEWLKTTSPPEGMAPAEPYFSGIAGPAYGVSLIWRAHIPAEGDLLWPRASDREAVDVPIGEVRQAFDEDEAICRLDRLDQSTVEKVGRSELRPGDTVVVAADRGLLDDFGWAPSSRATVVDVSVATHGLPLSKDALNRLCGVAMPQSLIDRALGTPGEDGDVDDDEQAEAVEEIVSTVSANPAVGWDPDEWRDFVSRLRREPVTARREVPRLPMAGKSVEPEPSSDRRDERSLATTATGLDAHCRAVAVRARSIAERIGLSRELAGVVEWAGRLHDLGKGDGRFQCWLDPRQESREAVAKSDMPRHRWGSARVAAGWPRGGRHEALSARAALEWLGGNAESVAERDLLVHLIVSHHGHGRPLVSPVEDGTGDMVSAQVQGLSVTVPADLEIVDWDQPRRFRRLNERFGPWGLALLEAVVRQADHEVSGGAAVSVEGYEWPK